MSSPAVLILGGNGHAPVRLEAARARLVELGSPFEIVELRYPRADTFDELLVGLESAIDAAPEGAPLYATGIGGLVALALRARGALRSGVAGSPRRLVLQGAVLWGLESRWFPRIMRIGPAPRWLAAAFRSSLVQRRFAARHFRSSPAPEFLREFFAGYDDAGAFASWFDWLTPALLRRLEVELPRSPGALDGIELWWGEQDTVVGLEEARVTERALGVRLPVRTFPEWGHYPMIDDPEGWVREVSGVVADALETA